METTPFICIIVLGIFITSHEAVKLPNRDLWRKTPKSDFSCESRKEGLYADVENNCKLFNMCKLESDNATLHKVTFFCQDNTVFDQKTLQCSSPQDAWPCSQAENLFNVTGNKFFLPDFKNETSIVMNNNFTSSTA